VRVVSRGRAERPRRQYTVNACLVRRDDYRITTNGGRLAGRPLDRRVGRLPQLADAEAAAASFSLIGQTISALDGEHRLPPRCVHRLPVSRSAASTPHSVVRGADDGFICAVVEDELEREGAWTTTLAFSVHDA
jgi:hypothetical protein